jgi:uncharacterized protein (DUF433 family)
MGPVSGMHFQSRDNFSPREAAVITGLNLKKVHHAIERGPLRKAQKRAHKESTSRLAIIDLLFLVAVAELGKEGLKLPPSIQHKLYSRLSSHVHNPGTRRPLSPALELRRPIFIDSWYLMEILDAGIAKLHEARERVVSDPEIMSGHPVFRGTRIPVHAIAEMMEQGASAKEMRAGYPSLKAKDFELALLYAQAYPERGRPIERWRNPEASL